MSFSLELIRHVIDNIFGTQGQESLPNCIVSGVQWTSSRLMLPAEVTSDLLSKLRWHLAACTSTSARIVFLKTLQRHEVHLETKTDGKTADHKKNC